MTHLRHYIWTAKDGTVDTNMTACGIEAGKVMTTALTPSCPSCKRIDQGS